MATKGAARNKGFSLQLLPLTYRTLKNKGIMKVKKKKILEFILLLIIVFCLCLEIWIIK